MVRGKSAFLIELMDTIAKLKEARGSALDKILNHLVAQRKTALKNAAVQVKMAIKTGLKTGLIKQVSGKFKLGLPPRTYAIFRSFRQLEKGSGGTNLAVKQIRRRKGTKGKSRRRKGRSRRKSNFDSLECGDEDSTDDYISLKNSKNVSKSGSFPVKKLRRRRGKKRSKSRRRRGRRRRRTDLVDSENLAMGTDESGSELMDRGRRRKGRSKRRKGRRRRGRRRSYGAEDDVDSVRSTETKGISDKSSDENPKTEKEQEPEDTGLGTSEPVNRQIVSADPPRSSDHQ